MVTKQKAAKQKGPTLEDRLAELLAKNELGDFIRQYAVSVNEMNYALDFAWPKEKVGVEMQGGIWINGRHVRARGYSDDRRRSNALQLDGWIILEFTTDFADLEVLAMVQCALELRRRSWDA